MGSYENEMKKSIQNQIDRKRKQEFYGIKDVNLNDPSDIRAAAPTMPAPGVKVLCQFCGKNIPESREGVPQAVTDRERKFRCCQSCRMGIVGPGGQLDRSTPHLQGTRDLKG